MSALGEDGTNGAGQPPAGRPPRAGEDRPRTRWRRWLLAGAALAGAVVIAASVAAAAVIDHHPRPAPRPPQRDTIFTFRPGQCVDYAPHDISQAHAVSCRRPHDGEIYGAFGVAGHRWPGTASLAARAHTGCLSRLNSYLNPQLATTGMTLSYIYPDRGAWAAGTRTVICEIHGSHGKLTGSVRAYPGHKG